jgi:hypothetical protein
MAGHISEQVAETLTASQWTALEAGAFTKRLDAYEEAGTVSNGARQVTLTIDESGRWLARLDGWGKVARDVDLREFPGAPGAAIAAVLA